jgi:hypothetical protein
VLIIFPLLSAYLIRKAVPPADAEPAGIESDQP